MNFFKIARPLLNAAEYDHFVDHADNWEGIEQVLEEGKPIYLTTST